MLLSFKSTLSWSFLQSLCFRIKPQSLLKRRIRTDQMREAPLILAYLNQRIKTTSAINIHLSSSPADRFLKAIFLRKSCRFIKEMVFLNNEKPEAKNCHGSAREEFC